MLNLSIRAKLQTMLLVLGATMLGISLTVSVLESQETARLHATETQSNNIVSQYLPLVKAVRDMQLDVVQVQQFLTDASATYDPQSFTAAAAYATDFTAQLAAVHGLLGQVAQSDNSADMNKAQAALTGIDQQFTSYNQTGITMANAYIHQGKAAGDALMTQFDPASEALNQRLQIIVPAVQNLINNSAQANDSSLQAALRQAALLSRIVYLCAAFGLLLAIASHFAINRQIITPLRALTARLRGLAHGELASPVPGTALRDEIGDMARCAEVFQQNLQEREKLQADAAEFQKTLTSTLCDMEAAFEEASAARIMIVEGIGAVLNQVVRGDLTIRFTQDVPDTHHLLKNNLNQTLNMLQETLVAVAANTQVVHEDTSELTQAIDDLARRTEQQAATLEETAAALGQITGSVRKTAESVTTAQGIVATAKQDAENSGDVLHATTEAMSGIESSSRQIGNIIGVIDEIAFQTNLLALNAGVEAARAGEAGRGFAVVAVEVRALAQRSANASKEIKELISTSSTQVENGVKMVDETGKALTRIAAQVTKLSGLMHEIDQAARDQSTGLSEVNTAVTQMDQVTQQNAAMVEQATAASHNLSAEANELTRLMAKFQLGHTAPALRPAAKPKAPPKAKPLPAMAGAEGGANFNGNWRDSPPWASAAEPPSSPVAGRQGQSETAQKQRI